MVPPSALVRISVTVALPARRNVSSHAAATLLVLLLPDAARPLSGLPKKKNRMVPSANLHVMGVWAAINTLGRELKANELGAPLKVAERERTSGLLATISRAAAAKSAAI